MSNETETNLESKRAPQLKLPTKNYKLRIKEEPTFSVTKNGNDMLTFNTEIVEDQNGAEVLLVKTPKGGTHELKIAGLEIPLRAVFFVSERTGQIQNIALGQLHRVAGFPLKFQRDPDTGLPVDDSGNPFSYVGIEFFARCEGTETVLKDEDGNNLTNPLTGKEVKTFSRQIREIYTPEDAED